MIRAKNLKNLRNKLKRVNETYNSSLNKTYRDTRKKINAFLRSADPKLKLGFIETTGGIINKINEAARKLQEKKKRPENPPITNEHNERGAPKKPNENYNPPWHLLVNMPLSKLKTYTSSLAAMELISLLEKLLRNLRSARVNVNNTNSVTYTNLLELQKKHKNNLNAYYNRMHGNTSINFTAAGLPPQMWR
jgi:hypothetical protein